MNSTMRMRLNSERDTNVKLNHDGYEIQIKIFMLQEKKKGFKLVCKNLKVHPSVFD